MMEQYYKVKQQYPDTLVLFRMGDFYELFFEDARLISKLLNITLTHRGKLGDHPIPMAGIPHHAAANYIDRLTSHGLKAAICEQVQDPKEAVGIVQRAVTQIVGPGIPYDIDKMPDHDGRYIACALEEKGKYYLCALDYTTGELVGHEASDFEEFFDTLRGLSPKEILCFPKQWKEVEAMENFLKHGQILSTTLAAEFFDAKITLSNIKKVAPHALNDKIVDMHQALKKPLGAICYYICATQSLGPNEKINLSHIRPLKMLGGQNYMRVTLSTLLALEIVPANREVYKDSLLGHMDHTLTAMGARQLRQLFLRPLVNIKHIQERFDVLEWMIEKWDELKVWKEKLKDIRDIERIMAKVSTNKATSSDLINLARATDDFFAIKPKDDVKNLPKNIKEAFKTPHQIELKALAQEILATLNDELGASLDKGNLIRPGANKQRDKLARLAQNAQEEMQAMEERYKKKTGLTKLRIKSNNVNGLFIEVSKGQGQKVPKDFERRQTLVNAERFVTKELIEFEKEIISAQEKLLRLEKEIFNNLIEKCAQSQSAIAAMAISLGQIDLWLSLAQVSRNEEFTRPTLQEEQSIIDLHHLWHPLIKAKQLDKFIDHQVKLTAKIPFALITGPNMAGKSTVMREVAMAQFLAQIGSFVPAKKATLGVCDYIFARLGANDDILKGQSTFMVEMSETSEILRHASKKSLIILDELGRGTSTYDGLSLAWAIVEYLANKLKALTLFATHYHELVDLVEKIPTAKNYTVEVKVHQGQVHFMYNLIEGGAAQSYGIYVAKLAGIPETVLKRAQEKLHELEDQLSALSDDKQVKNGPMLLKEHTCNQQLSFFTLEEESAHNEELLAQNAQLSQSQKIYESMKEELGSIDLNNTTPFEAMMRLKKMQESFLQ